MTDSTSDSTKSRRTRVGAYGLVTRPEEILLCRISARLPRWHGHWTLPGGGIDFGEQPVDAMIREVYEETGLQVLPGRVLDVDAIFDDTEAVAFHGVRILYDIVDYSGELRFEAEGTTDCCRWFSLEETRGLPLVGLAGKGLKLAFAD